MNLAVYTASLGTLTKPTRVLTAIGPDQSHMVQVIHDGVQQRLPGVESYPVGRAADGVESRYRAVIYRPVIPVEEQKER